MAKIQRKSAKMGAFLSIGKVSEVKQELAEHTTRGTGIL